MGRKRQSITMVLSVTIGLLVLMLMIVLGLAAKAAFDRQREADHIVTVVELVRDMYQFDELARTEQGAVTTLSTAAGANDERAIGRLMDTHRAVVRALDKVTGPRPGALDDLVNFHEIAKARERQQQAFNVEIAALALPAPLRPAHGHDEYIAASQALVTDADFQSDTLSHEYSGVDVFVDEMTKVGRIAWDIRALMGPDRRLVLDALKTGQPLTEDKQRHAVDNKRIMDASWTVLQNQARWRDIPPALREALAGLDKDYFHDARALRQTVLAQAAAGHGVTVTVDQWLAVSTRGIASLGVVSKTAMDLIIAHVAEQGARANRELIAAIGFILWAVGMAVFAAFTAIRLIILPLHQISHTMKAVTKGDMDCPIPLQDRQDEIGEFARTLRAFRDSAVECHRLEAAKQSAETASRVKSQFLANMSHELRTPLNAIIGFSGVMREKMFGPQPPKYEEYANLIHESGHHLLNLISDILDVAKIEAGKFALDLHDVDLSATADYCLEMVRRRAEDGGIMLVRRIAPNLPALTADATAMKQILLNLLSNAVKFTAQGGMVSFTAAEVDGKLRLVVRDNGRGIPAEALHRIGHAFEQANNDPAHAREGTGLGLALVRALVERHHGTMKLESKEGVGTKVTVDLPFTQDATQETAQDAAA